MFNKKIVATLLSIAIISVCALVLGCTGDNTTASPTPTAAASVPALSGDIKVTGSTSVQPYADELAQAFEDKYRNTRVLVSGVGSGPGIKATADGTTDIGMSSRELKPEEEAQGLKAIPIAIDGLAVIVNKDNPVSDLTSSQIKEIYAGNITNWKEVGGSDAPITVFTRESSSGTRGAFEELIMHKGTKVNITDRALQQSTTGGIIQAIQGNKNSIGYISYGSMSDSVKALKVDGVAPSAETIEDKTYKLQRPFLFVTRGDPTGEVAKAFIEFTLSPEGQNILKEGKLVPVSN